MNDCSEEVAAIRGAVNGSQQRFLDYPTLETLTRNYYEVQGYAMVGQRQGNDMLFEKGEDRRHVRVEIRSGRSNYSVNIMVKVSVLR